MHPTTIIHPTTPPRNRTPMTSSYDVERQRSMFPALSRMTGERPAVFFDGPAGSQVPQQVIDAVSRYLAETNANHGGTFATSVESDQVLDHAQHAAADFLGTADPDLVVFGANMTTLTFSLSRSLSRDWSEGDEIIVSRLDHDANYTPWTSAARDAGATVKHIEVRKEDCTLDMDSLREQLSSRTRLVAVGCASNAAGTINPFQEIIALAHEVGAKVFLDAVHYAPHARLSADDWDCDFLACSAYKFFGPHVGLLWGKREWMTTLPAYQVRPAGNDVPDRWLTGTQNHEGIAGTAAAIEYLADLGRSLQPSAKDRGAALSAAFREITAHEQELCKQLLDGLSQLSSIRVWGITDLESLSHRVPTVSFTHARHAPRQVAEFLAERGIFVWHGNYYALPLTEALDLEPDGMVRIGLLHYNPATEVERLLAALAELE
ncbi:MAG: cysteine desulfurase-like protein [Planctomycetales bacterium]